MNSLIISAILLIAVFLRTVNLSISMPFIGDQGWFYLSARDMLVYGKIPLVGITSSHIWLHQGPLWTYMLSIAFFLFNFNPLSGAYITALFGVGTVYLMYKLGSKMFSEKVGLIAAALYAVSPLIVYFDRMPFDPSPIPFLTVLFVCALYKWINGGINYFPFIVLTLALLYNLELATFTLFFPFALFLVYGFIKNKNWVKKLFNKKTIIYSLGAFIIPMFPIIIYDFSNGFKQTIVFLGWTIYKPFSFLIKHSSGNLIENLNIVINFILINIQKLIFQLNLFLAVLIFLFSLLLLIYLILKNRKIVIKDPKFLLLFLLVISLLGILLNQTPSDAYLPIIFPFVVFTVAIFLDYLMNKKGLKYIATIFICLMLLTNIYYGFKSSFRSDLKARMAVVDKIIALTNGKKYNLIGYGPGSQFKSFIMNYEYLLWWKGYPPTKTKENTKIYISEDSEGIHVGKKL